jgi:hypothetical protein
MFALLQEPTKMNQKLIIFILIALGGVPIANATSNANELARLRAVSEFAEQNVSDDVSLTNSPCPGEACVRKLIRDYNRSYGSSFRASDVMQEVLRDQSCLRTEGPGATSTGYRFDEVTYGHYSTRCLAKAIARLKNPSRRDAGRACEWSDGSITYPRVCPVPQIRPGVFNPDWGRDY